MPDKIVLPPKVKCWRCKGTGQIVVIAGTIERKPDYPEDMVGIPLRDFEPCDCDDGWRYDFDAVAAAVAKAATLFYEQTGPHPTGVGIKKYQAKIYTNFPRKKIRGEGPTPTAALVAAVLAYNELATLPEK